MFDSIVRPVVKLYLFFGTLGWFILLGDVAVAQPEGIRSSSVDSLATQLNQATTDSARVSLLFELVLITTDQNRDLMLHYTRKLLAEAHSLGDPEWIFRGYEKLSLTFILRREYDSATHYLQLAEVYAHNNGIAPYQVHNLSAYLYMDRGNYEAAVLSCLKAIDLLDSLEAIDKGNPEKFASVYNNLALIYSDRLDYEKAIPMLKEVIRIGEEINHPYTIDLGVSNLGSTYAKMGRYEEALDYLLRSVSHTERINDYFHMADAIGEVGKVYVLKGDLQEAKKSFKKSVALYKDVGSSHGEHEYSAELAHLHLLLDELDEAFSMAFSVYQANEDKVSKSYLKVTRVIGSVYEKQGDFKQALQFEKEYHTLSDSSSQLLYSNRILEFEKNLEFERQEQEQHQLIVEKEKADLLYQEDLKQQRLIQGLAFIGILFVATIAFVLYRNNQRKHRANRILIEKNQEISRQSEALSRQNTQLQELGSFKQGLTHMIAHDMKNPLNVVIGLSEYNPKPENFKEIAQSGKTMLQLIMNMLDVQKFEERAVRLQNEHLPLYVLVREARIQVELLLVAKGIRLQEDFENQTSLYVDRNLIVRVLVNLLTNAIKYTNAQGNIRILAQKLDSDRIQIVVEDTGRGIATDDLPYVFDKFWQEDKQASGRIQSTGLGLTFCKFAIEAHGGEISVRSEPGNGTTFFMDLPGGYANEINKEFIRKEDAIPKGTSEWSEFDLAEVVNYAEQIKDLPIYKLSKIDRILNVIEEGHHSEVVINWKREVLRSVYNNDPEDYRRLTTDIHSLSD